jgi:hypothetical protein
MSELSKSQMRRIAYQVMKENEELLEKLGSDYDEQGVPYWEKWEKKEDES